MFDDSYLPTDGQSSRGVAFGMTDMTVFRDRSLPTNVKVVYVALVGYADSKTRVCWPSRERLAWDTGLSVRAVGRAVKAAEDAGLVEITHTQSSNVYRILDFTRGYEVGSGPGGLTVLPGRPESPSQRVRESSKLEQRTRPDTQTISSGDAFAAGGHRASATTAREIITDAQWRLIGYSDVGPAAHYLIKAAYGVMDASGIVPANNARDQMARVLRDCSTKEHALATVQAWMRNLDKPGENGYTLRQPPYMEAS